MCRRQKCRWWRLPGAAFDNISEDEEEEGADRQKQSTVEKSQTSHRGMVRSARRFQCTSRRHKPKEIGYDIFFPNHSLITVKKRRKKKRNAMHEIWMDAVWGIFVFEIESRREEENEEESEELTSTQRSNAGDFNSMPL